MEQIINDFNRHLRRLRSLYDTSIALIETEIDNELLRYLECGTGLELSTARSICDGNSNIRDILLVKKIKLY